LEEVLKFRRNMRNELARLNPVVLEFWKRVLFSSDEFIDLSKFEHRSCSSSERLQKFKCSLLRSLEAIDVNCNLSSSFMAEILIGSASFSV
jgi:hypothetical protein